MKQKLKNLVRSLVPAVYTVGRVFLKKGAVLSAEEAMTILHRHHPDPAGSCLWDNPLPEPEYDLTVILPVYNVERYLEQCLTSVLDQRTRYSFRVIAVDDGSTDSSPQILERHRSHQRLTILRQNNAGVSAARNAALLGVKSRYVMFLDADDHLEPGAIQAMMDAAAVHDADLIQGGYLCFRDEDNGTVYDRRFPDGTGDRSRVTGMVCAKVYRSRLFERVCFPQGYWYEDTAIWLLVLPISRKIATVSQRIYRYRRHGASITGSDRGKARTLDTCYVTLSALSAREGLGLESDQVLYANLLRQAVINCKRTLTQPDQVRRSVFALSHHLLRQHRPEKGAALNGWEARLEQALLEGNFPGYILLCRTWPQ